MEIDRIAGTLPAIDIMHGKYAIQNQRHDAMRDDERGQVKVFVFKRDPSRAFGLFPVGSGVGSVGVCAGKPMSYTTFEEPMPLEKAALIHSKRDTLRSALLAAVDLLPELPDGIRKMLQEDMRLTVAWQTEFMEHLRTKGK